MKNGLDSSTDLILLLIVQDLLLLDAICSFFQYKGSYFQPNPKCVFHLQDIVETVQSHLFPFPILELELVWLLLVPHKVSTVPVAVRIVSTHLLDKVHIVVKILIG